MNLVAVTNKINIEGVRTYSEIASLDELIHFEPKK